MKLFRPAILLLIISVGFQNATAQEMKFAGTHPPNPAVIKLLEREGEIMDKERNVSIRDSLRRQILSPAYFYHGIDGLPIELDGLTKRQTKNQFQFLEGKILSETLFQYETTAILIATQWQKVKDKGEIHEKYGSYLLVMGLENGEWKIQADIVGQNPKIPSK